ncbi:MAG TPA: hypothetical protein VGJ20_34550 [Xanthobacteraceae bacterium]
MSLLSSLHNAGNSVRWAGPVVAAFGLSLIVLITLTQQQSFFGQWFLSQALAPERILPIVGLGLASGLVGLRIFFTALVLLIIGILGGFAAYDRVIFLLFIAWNPPSDFSVTGSIAVPISCLAAGSPLLCRERLRAWLLPVAAFVAGTMLAIDILLTESSQGDPLFTYSPLVVAFSPIVVALWTIISVSLTVRAFRHNWLVIFGRILGSWTVAIGVLYGGASATLVLRPLLSSGTISRVPARGSEVSPSVVDGKTGRKPPWRTLWQREPLQP